MLAKLNPTQTSAWRRLLEHYNVVRTSSVPELFESDSERFKSFSRHLGPYLWDFSKNLVTHQTWEILEQLFEQCGVPEAIAAQFNGEKINETEQRAVLHSALRNFSGKPVLFNGEDVMPAVKRELDKMREFSSKLESGDWQGYKGDRITDIVNIGIGGSDLGPAMMYEALSPFHLDQLKCHFVSNVDGAHIEETLKGLNRESTLFIVASKTFTTQETMTNAHTARAWFLEGEANASAIEKHFVAVSTNEEKVKQFGINTAQMFQFWDWVGGRYSVWSSIGLSVCCGIGYQNFEQVLRGAHTMDQHFTSASFHDNIPMLMAALGIWYVNFCGAETEAIIPYQQNMSQFAAYFQQANMESNGKSVDRNGERVNYQTGPIVWGEPGTNGQHAFFQLIHQGTRLIPCDFVGFVKSCYPQQDHHHKLMANFFAQTEALMQGRSFAEASKNAEKDSQKAAQAPFRVFEGSKPTTTILGEELNPYSLGMLIAAYEHKIFVQGVVWNIYSYDQWGVELGKELANNILPELDGRAEPHNHDLSTQGLIEYYLKHQG